MKARLICEEFPTASDILPQRKTDVRSCDLHGHNFYELEIIVAGEAPVVFGGEEMIARRGTAFFLTPEDFHEYPSKSPLALLNIQFSGGAVQSDLLLALTSSARRIFSLSPDDLTTVCELFSLIERLSATGDTERPRRLLEALLLTLRADLPAGQTEKKASYDMQRAVAYLHEHFKENPSLGEVAALLSLNKQYFCGKFKEYTGYGYKEYLRARKLSYARRLLLSGNHTITEVAGECGYATQSHFNREFKAYFGTSPLALRKSAETNTRTLTVLQKKTNPL